MKPINFPESNLKLQKPPGMTDKDCAPLPIHTDGQTCISCWELSHEEINTIIKNRVVWIGVLSGETQPPVWLSADRPFEEKRMASKYKPGHHINRDGQFQSDKYKVMKPDKISLSFHDVEAQPVLRKYAEAIIAKGGDVELGQDIIIRLDAIEESQDDLP